MEFKIATSWDDLIKVFTVRAVVFIGEQNTPYDEEIDQHECCSLHILGEVGDEPAAAGRIRFLGEYAKLERIAVRKEYRGQNHGHQLMEFMLDTAREHGFRKLKMHAQAHLCDFYRRYGFEVQGPMFQEANIDHYLMVRED